ncbi:MAG: response regulator [Myxococcota bacterium]
MPVGGKKTVLVVDDEDLFLKTVADGFSAYADKVHLLTASNGKVAVDILGRTRVDLVVTDLKMPEMDGFGLLAHMSRFHPDVPVIVMTAFGTPEIELDLHDRGIMLVMDKPIDFPALATNVMNTLVVGAAGHLAGIALPTFLQMVEMDRKTCTLRVRSGDNAGLLYFKHGTLTGAEMGALEGAEAAMEIAVWERPELDILSGPMPKKSNLNLSVSEVLLEAFRLHDERGRQRLRGGSTQAEPVPPNAQQDVAAASAPAATTPSAGAARSGVLGPSSELNRKESLMSANEKLKELATLDGFAGVALYTPQGELLAMQSSDVASLGDVGVLANNVLMNAQKASLDMGTGRGQQVHVEAENANIVVRCLNEGTDPLHSQPGKAHIHMVLVLKKDAPIGMAKLKVNSTIQKLAEDFRF